jgi:FdhD protein
MKEFEVKPDPDDKRLSRIVTGIDQNGATVDTSVVTEQPLTLFLNAQEIVTMMTIGDYPDLLAVGYLLNQNMLLEDDKITAIEHDEDLGIVVVRTERKTDYEEKLKKKVQTSGCAQGTTFGDLMERFEEVNLNRDVRLKTSWLYAITRKINTAPSLYLKAGAIHGCALCEEDRPLLYVEDVGRHNAVDKIAGYMFLNSISPDNKIFYTTGRLTSEMVIKSVKMGLPILVSRSGFTAWGVELAREANLTLIGRARGKRFVALSGAERIIFDDDTNDDDAHGDQDRRSAAPKPKGAQSASPNSYKNQVAGVVLAGGLSRRMGGGNKSLKPIGGRPMIAHTLARLVPQAGVTIINANDGAEAYCNFDHAVIPDTKDGHAGPLAGVLTGMQWSRGNAPKARWIVTAAADTPFFPDDLVDRLVAAVGDKEGTIALAKSNDKLHPVFGLWPIALADDLATWLEDDNNRKVLAWVDRHELAEVTFTGLEVAGEVLDPFFNVNTPEDLEVARSIAAEIGQ